MAQNENSKVILAVVLLVAAVGVFAWRYSTREKAPSIAASSEFKDAASTSLEELLSHAASKGWKDSKLWTDARTAQYGAKAAEEIFGTSPSIGDVKILDTNKDSDDYSITVLTLQVSGNDTCINVSITKDKNGKDVFANVSKSLVSVKDFKAY